jgi:hypothetical protein
MWTVPNNTTTSAKGAGIDQQLAELRDLLAREWETANETFMLFREQDSHYQDPRTDYTLGRRTAVELVIKAVDELLAQRTK